MNKAVLKGRLTKDPELKSSNSGKLVTTFTLAVDRYNKEVDFITCVAWDKKAEFLSNYFKKGSEVLLCGRIQVRSWNTQSGEKRYATEVVADELYFCGGKKEEPKAEPEQVAWDETINNEEIPF